MEGDSNGGRRHSWNRTGGLDTGERAWCRRRFLTGTLAAGSVTFAATTPATADPIDTTATTTDTEDASGWRQQTKIVAGDGDSMDYFGDPVAVAADGDVALVGASGDEDPNGR